MGKLMANSKNVKLILAALVILALIFAAVLLAVGRMNMNGEVMAENSVDTVDVEALDVDASSEHAQKLYDSRVEDINDTAAVAELLKVMELENVTGKFTTTITDEEGTKVFSISVATGVQQTDKSTFDDNMIKCAQQLMALIPSIGKVQWTYSVISADGESESVTDSLDAAEASEQLPKDISEYGKSAEAFEKLLNQQAE